MFPPSLDGKYINRLSSIEMGPPKAAIQSRAANRCRGIVRKRLGRTMHDVLQVLDITGQNLLELGPDFFLALFIAAMVDLLYLGVVARRSFRRRGLLGIL